MRRWRLLACDFDRTLTEHPRGLHPAVPAAFARARAAGLRVAVCSGQPLARLQAVLPGVDALVAENGAVVAAPVDAPPVRHPWPERAGVLAALGAAGVPWQAFDVILDVPRAHEAALAKALAGFGGTAAVPNVDSVNVQPAGISKGTGLASVQRALGVPPEATVAVGDGENDLPLFRAAGLAVAVANATPVARAAARLQLALPDGLGVARLVDDLLAGRHDP